MHRSEAIMLATLILHEEGHGDTIQRDLERAEALYALAHEFAPEDCAPIVAVGAAIELRQRSRLLVASSDENAVHNARTLLAFIETRYLAHAPVCGTITNRDLGDEHEEAAC